MRLDTFVYQRALRYKNNFYRGLGWLPSAGLMVFWIFENGWYNFYSYVVNPPPSGVKRREAGEDVED